MQVVTVKTGQESVGAVASMTLGPYHYYLTQTGSYFALPTQTTSMHPYRLPTWMVPWVRNTLQLAENKSFM